jgi:hypothetical protein
MSPGETLAGALAISSGRVSFSDYFSSSIEIGKFFGKEACNSAAMHQINENLLRAATQERSLQQAGATIPGAAAETDKFLPPGRFARFVDGCNAFFREPANSRHRPANAWCKCLSEQYRTPMSRDEESLYANDFERLLERDRTAEINRPSMAAASSRVRSMRTIGGAAAGSGWMSATRKLSQVPISRVGSNGRCNTIWYKAFQRWCL